MGSFYREGGYAKDKAFMESVVLQHHELYTGLPNSTKAMCILQAFRGHYNIELLFEETLSHVNPGLIRTKDVYMDYTDGTDAKCLGIMLRFSGNRKIVRGAVTGISKKVSWIRLAVYNDFKGTVDYFLIPTDHGCKITYNRYGGRIPFHYAHTQDKYSNGLDKYRVADIFEVAKEIRDAEEVVDSCPDCPAPDGLRS